MKLNILQGGDYRTIEMTEETENNLKAAVGKVLARFGIEANISIFQHNASLRIESDMMPDGDYIIGDTFCSSGNMSIDLFKCHYNEHGFLDKFDRLCHIMMDCDDSGNLGRDLRVSFHLGA